MNAVDKPSTFWVDVFGGNLDDVNETPLEVASLNIGITQYSLVDSVAELADQATSFYWDDAEQKIYIRTDDPYWILGDISAGVIRSFIDKIQYDTSGFATALTENYEPRLLLDSVDISESLDPTEYGIFRYDRMAVEIDNSDGEYDNIEEESAGQGFNIIYGHCDDDVDMTSDDLMIVRSGYVERIEFNGFNTVIITGKDKRKKWSDKIGNSILTSAEFTNLPDNMVGKRKPLAIGQCYNVPCIAVNSTTFMFSDDDFLDATVTMAGVAKSAVFKADNVYVGGASVVFTGTGASGTFVIPSYTSGAVTADVNSTCTLTDVEKILLLLNQFQGLAFLPSNYDTAEVITANSTSTTGGIFINQNGESLNSVIEQLLINIGGWLIQKGQVFTIRVYSSDKVGFREIEYDELANAPAWYFDEEQFVSSVTTKYYKDWKENEYRTVYDNSLEADAIADQYRLANKEIETTLLTSSEAEEIGLRYYERFAEIPRTVELNVLSDISELYPSDIFIYELKRLNAMSNKGIVSEKIIADRANYMITNIDKLNKSITGVWIADNPAPVYTVMYLYNERLYNEYVYGGNNL